MKFRRRQGFSRILRVDVGEGWIRTYISIFNSQGKTIYIYIYISISSRDGHSMNEHM